MTPIEFIEHLHAENEAFYRDDRGRGALKDLQVVFPVPWIYLAELVQNAIDAAATRIRFAPDAAGALLFEHNGKAFNPADVRALCTRGVSTKSTNTVGFMGVGFKSVFKTYETVVVSSREWQFQLSVRADDTFGVRQWIGAVLPTWTTDADQPSDGYSCRFQFSQRVIAGTCDDDLSELLREGEALLPLLGWNRVIDFAVGNNSWRLSATEAAIDGGDASRVRVEASSPHGSRRSWLLFVKSYQPSEAAVLRFLQHRQIQPSPDERDAVLSKARRVRDVSLFCEVSADGSPHPVNRGQCFSLVPTGHTTCLGLHMQADWLLDISRREPMRIANDPWQQEILAQVPHLLKSYLDWLTSDEMDGALSWSAGYGALPGPSEDTEIDAALHGGGVTDLLCTLLEECRFIPCERAQGNIEFATPAGARFLPDALQRATYGANAVPTDTFGPRIVAAGTLGTRATAFLRANRLLTLLTPTELEAEWDSGKIEEWYKRTADAPDAAYVRLIAGLAELDVEPGWAEAALRCLPAADGVWRARRDVQRYPPNWAILSPSPRVAAALERFIAVSHELLAWKTDQTLRRDAAAQRYLQALPEAALEQVASNWWASLTEELGQADRELVVEFTELVRRQKTLPRLVTKVLAVRGDGERLLPMGQVLLGDPYAGEYRRALFPSLPTISRAYLTSSDGATDADWRAFFESQEPAPKGRSMLMLSRRGATEAELNSLAIVPDLRVTHGRDIWHGVTIDSNTHYVVDAQWPAAVELVAGNVGPAQALALQRWMLEMPGFFETWRWLSMVYIPRKSSSVSSSRLPTEAAWLVALKERAWLFDEAGRGPYRAADLLAHHDASRPDAPVALLAQGFVVLASELGLVFGGAIPNAPAIERLRTLGASASWPELLNLVEDSIAEAGVDKERVALLQSVLTQTPLFALPHGTQTPDGQWKVSGSRVVNGTRRSTLADWVCCVDSFSDEGPERKVFKQMSSVVELPEATTSQHANAFLRWVWSTEPDADKVRQILPRAFQYALALPEEAKADLGTAAKVFATTRRWLRVADGNVYLNDLEISDRDLMAADEHVALATPGHLGDDDATRRQVCALLGLQLASARYSLEIEERVGDALVPESWRSGFRHAQAVFWRRVAGVHDDDAANTETPTVLELVGVDAVIRRLLKDGVELDAHDSCVAIRDGRAHVVGEPLSFASELAQALIEHWGITLRRDGYALGSRLTGLLARIDRTVPEQESNTAIGPVQDEPSDVDPARGNDSPTTHGANSTSPSSEPGDHAPKGKPGGTPTHTVIRKDTQHDWLLSKRHNLKQELKDVERQIAEGLGAEVVPIEDDTPDDERPRKPFGDDKDYREAVATYERQKGRFPELTDARQPGYDIDSHSHEIGHPERALVRRIEVKGKGVLWVGGEVVELSDRQLKDALAKRVQNGERIASDFDYWLYVVETTDRGHQVLPIRNPARRAAKFEFRGGVWRSESEQASMDDNE